MTVPVFALAAVLAAQAQSVPVPASSQAPLFTARFDTDLQQQQRQQQPDQRDRGAGERPHSVGVGGQMTMGSGGGGGGIRYFLSERLGVNFIVGVARGPRYDTPSRTDSSSTFYAMPSAILMLSRPDPTRDVDLRPYVGGGITYVRATSALPVTAPGSTSTTYRRSGVGAQAFGGVEITFREADFITISAEGMYYKLPVSYINASVIDGFNYALMFHFYLK